MSNLSDFIVVSPDHTHILSDITDAGTAAAQADTRYAHRDNNLSDLGNVVTARSNLGLGNAAIRNYTVSTGSPSGGANGDVHYTV